MGLRMGAALLSAALLAGCSSSSGGVVGAAAGQVAQLLRGEAPQSARGAVSAEKPTAEAVAADPGAFRGIELRRLGLADMARRVSGSGSRETFATSSGVTMTFEDGMLVATRGLIFDLLAADASQTRAALRRGGGSAVRVHETLDGLDRVVRAEFVCEILPTGPETVDLGLRKVAARGFTESCEGGGLAFENAYWLDAAGEIVRSRQFVTLGVAYLRASRV